MGGAPAKVSGRGASVCHQDGRTVFDTVSAELVWANGVAMQWSATLASSYGGQFEVLHCVNAAIRMAWTHAWLFKEVDSPTQGWEVYATRQQFFNDEGNRARGRCDQARGPGAGSSRARCWPRHRYTTRSQIS
jgi:hypothetical protein